MVHAVLAREIAPMKIACGEHIPAELENGLCRTPQFVGRLDGSEGTLETPADKNAFLALLALSG
jgi:hypothetical protein